ncbi:MAG: DUF2238 domain-containing protein [Verrucomicrobiae bacterium]|nr:DUF2238 domain-containing protein [Verrucomicrobiae bacterium]
MHWRDKYLVILLSTVVAVLVWSAVRPHDFLTWILEVFPALAGIAILVPTRKRFPLTPLLYTLIALHMIILSVGGHYTYALVPIGDWVRDWLGLERNHYDRLGHFTQGFVPAMIARELFLRLDVVAKRGWLNYLIGSVCLAISAVYELIEWAAALIMGQSSDSFLGTQGDVWDTQSDMFLCLIGAIAALSLLPTWHNKQLRELAD